MNNIAIYGHVLLKQLYTKYLLNEEGTNLSAENNITLFQMNALVVIRVEVKKCEQTLLCMTCTTKDASLEVKGQQVVQQLQQLLLRGCHLDV